MTKADIFSTIDAQCDKAHRWIRARAIADRRGLAQLTRMDHFFRSVKK